MGPYEYWTMFVGENFNVTMSYDQFSSGYQSSDPNITEEKINDAWNFGDTN